MTKGIICLFRESWEIYRSKLKIFLSIIILPVVLIIAGAFIPLVGEEPVKAFIIAVILLLTAIFISLFIILAILFVLKDNFGLKESYKKSLKALFSFSEVCFLLFCLSISWIISGIILFLLFMYLHLQLAPLLFGQPLEFGLMPDYLIEKFIIFSGLGFLFVVIGTIFFIKLFSSIYISVFEKKGVIKSLLRSRELVVNNFWKVLWRVFVLGFTIMIIGFLFRLTLILTGINLTVIDIISYIFTWFIIPFCLIYGFLIYKDLQEVKTETPGWDFSKKKKTGYITIGRYIITGILGLLIGLSYLGVAANLIYRANDEPPHNDRDLWLTKIETPIQDNAFYDLAPYFISLFKKELFLEHWPEQEKQVLKEIEFKKVYWPDDAMSLIDKILKNKEWDKEFAKYLLEKNEQVLNDFKRAVKRPYFQNPVMQDPKNIGMEIPILSVSPKLTITRLNLIKSAYLFEQGKEKEAFEQAIKIIRMGQMLQDGQSGLISYLIGKATKKWGLRR